MKSQTTVAMFTCAVMLTPASAEVLSLKVDNDIFSGGRDGHYTSGLEASKTFVPSDSHRTRGLADAIPGWTSTDLSHVSYRLGHQMYTPELIESAQLQKQDRPYAALFYTGTTLLSLQQLQGRKETNSLSIDVGLVGPGAGGKTIQRSVHKLTGSDEPRGWKHQLRNEPFINIGYQKRWWFQENIAGLELEYGPSAGGTAGNLYTYLSSGAGMRIGRNLSRSVDLPSTDPTSIGAQFFQPNRSLDWFIYANVEGRYMAHNMLLDGNTFRDSHSVDREEWVGDAQLGFAITLDSWRLSIGNVWRTKEFRGQEEHNQFGAITLSTSL